MKKTLSHLTKLRQYLSLSTPACVCSSLLLLFCSKVLAGGFQLSDHSVTSLGRAHAGYGLVADDASAAHFNPAAMSLLNDQQYQLGAAFIKAEGQFTNTGSTDDNQGVDFDGAQDSVTPNAYFILPIGDKIRFGLGLTSPFGTHTHYDTNNFVGRFSGTKTQITTVNINPSVSYKINDTVSIGFGISYQTFDATLTGSILPNFADSVLTIEGDSKKWGYNLGAMFNLSNDSRLGISYRSKIDHEIEGSATISDLSIFDGSHVATADFTAPETLYVGYTNALNKQWQLSLGYRWTRWSQFQRLDVLFPTGPIPSLQSSSIVTIWDDSTTVSIGADYALNDDWVLHAGLAYDESPVPNGTRSVRTVDSHRTWYSIGATYKVNKKLQLDMAYRYIGFDNATVNQNITRSGASIGSLIGEYNDINITTFAIQANYKL